MSGRTSIAIVIFFFIGLGVGYLIFHARGQTSGGAGVPGGTGGAEGTGGAPGGKKRQPVHARVNISSTNGFCDVDHGVVILSECNNANPCQGDDMEWDSSDNNTYTLIWVYGSPFDSSMPPKLVKIEPNHPAQSGPIRSRAHGSYTAGTYYPYKLIGTTTVCSDPGVQIDP
jgi:hypothetical protein